MKHSSDLSWSRPVETLTKKVRFETWKYVFAEIPWDFLQVNDSGGKRVFTSNKLREPEYENGRHLTFRVMKGEFGRHPNSLAIWRINICFIRGKSNLSCSNLLLFPFTALGGKSNTPKNDCFPDFWKHSAELWQRTTTQTESIVKHGLWEVYHVSAG